MFPLYDAHNHLQDEWLTPHRPLWLPEMDRIGLRGAVVNGTIEHDWPEVTALARDHSWVLPSYGLHPWFIAQRTNHWESKLTALLDAGGCAVGEIGLDRWKEPFDFADQELVFRKQLAMAAERNLPVTIHCLKAWGAMESILKSDPVPERGFLLHAYGGSQEMVRGFVERGAYFSFSGYFLLSRKEDTREVFRHIPLDRLLVETDAPAMPVPKSHRVYDLPDTPEGEPVNHPGNLMAAYAGLAEIRSISIGELAIAVEKNFRRLFGG